MDGKNINDSVELINNYIEFSYWIFEWNIFDVRNHPNSRLWSLARLQEWSEYRAQRLNEEGWNWLADNYNRNGSQISTNFIYKISGELLCCKLWIILIRSCPIRYRFEHSISNPKWLLSTHASLIVVLQLFCLWWTYSGLRGCLVAVCSTALYQVDYSHFCYLYLVLICFGSVVMVFFVWRHAHLNN